METKLKELQDALCELGRVSGHGQAFERLSSAICSILTDLTTPQVFYNPPIQFDPDKPDRMMHRILPITQILGGDDLTDKLAESLSRHKDLPVNPEFPVSQENASGYIGTGFPMPPPIPTPGLLDLPNMTVSEINDALGFKQPQPTQSAEQSLAEALSAAMAKIPPDAEPNA